MGFVKESKIQLLEQQMLALHIFEADISEKFISAKGSGGQKVNKTSSSVYLKHLPSGIEIKCGKSRFRQQNRFFARRLLVEKIDQLQNGNLSKSSCKQRKIKKQKSRRKRKSIKKYIQNNSED